MPFAEDRDPFFADFAATSCTIGGVAVSAIFDAPSADVLNAAGDAPSLLIKTSDAAGATRGAAVVVDGSSFTVVRTEPDGTGMTRVTLQRV